MWATPIHHIYFLPFKLTTNIVTVKTTLSFCACAIMFKLKKNEENKSGQNSPVK